MHHEARIVYLALLFTAVTAPAALANETSERMRAQFAGWMNADGPGQTTTVTLDRCELSLRMDTTTAQAAAINFTRLDLGDLDFGKVQIRQVQDVFAASIPRGGVDDEMIADARRFLSIMPQGRTEDAKMVMIPSDDSPSETINMPSDDTFASMTDEEFREILTIGYLRYDLPFVVKASADGTEIDSSEKYTIRRRAFYAAFNTLLADQTMETLSGNIIFSTTEMEPENVKVGAMGISRELNIGADSEPILMSRLRTIFEYVNTVCP